MGWDPGVLASRCHWQNEQNLKYLQSAHIVLWVLRHSGSAWYFPCKWDLHVSEHLKSCKRRWNHHSQAGDRLRTLISLHLGNRTHLHFPLFYRKCTLNQFNINHFRLAIIGTYPGEWWKSSLCNAGAWGLRYKIRRTVKAQRWSRHGCWLGWVHVPEWCSCFISPGLLVDYQLMDRF